MAKKKARGAKVKKAKAKGKDVLVVASKVKAYVKGKKCNTSADAVTALSDKVYAMLDDAIARAGGNKRKTVKAQDV
jgi:histone H3/H4